MATEGKKTNVKKAAPKKTAAKKEEVVKQHKDEFSQWQAKIDEAKMQLSLATMESKEKLQKHLDSLENEFFKAKKRMEIFDDAASHAWENISDEIKSSFKTMKETYNKTKDYYK